MSRLRVASLQYYFRPVRTFDEFRDQVEALVETAADYHCRLVVFPEYFTAQLLTLGNVKRPIELQIRDLAHQVPRVVDMMSTLSRKHGVYVVAGTIPTCDPGDERVYNDCYFFNPRGEHAVQGKLHMTRFEVKEWKVSPRNRLHVFETEFGRMAIAICYDVEFPELARAAARAGAKILAVPSCTDDRMGYLRVRYCSHARAIENQMYVIQASTVGSIPMVPAVHLNYGQAAIMSPSDYAFARDGVVAEGIANAESMVIGELDLDVIEQSREFGTVLPLLDSAHTADLVRSLDVVVL
jgi:predicted amidohydrolase